MNNNSGVPVQVHRTRPNICLFIIRIVHKVHKTTVKEKRKQNKDTKWIRQWKGKLKFV